MAVVPVPCDTSSGGSPPLSSYEYETEILGVESATFLIDTSAGDMVSWSVRNREGEVTLNAAHFASPVTMDIGEVVGSSVPGFQNDRLNEQAGITVDATSGSARVIILRRNP